MYTSKFEVYRPLKKHRSRRLFILLLCYIVVVSARVGIMFLLGWVIEANPQYGREDSTPSVSDLASSDLKGQKYFYVSAFLKFRVTKNTFSFKKKYLDYDELVVVTLRYPLQDTTQDTSIIRMIAHVLTFGIVKSRAPLALRRVVALPGDTVVYNAQHLLSVNEKRYVTAADSIPFLSTPRTVVLGEGEYFLVSPQEYGIDDKVMGPSTLSVVRGKVVFKLGPDWGWYHPRR